ncbi:MAG: hypothetical protein K8L99_16685 [Anaerolineae bacterium]|nr:hypothetical protein [Anaerolineae bacterium]
MSLSEQPTPELQQRCETETQKFRQKRPYVTDTCFELFRRALADGDNEAFAAIYRIYLPLVYYWVSVHPDFVYINLPADDCVSDAMQRLYRGLRGGRFQQKMSSLETVLAYLKKCVNSVVMEERRRRPRPDVELDEALRVPRESLIDRQLFAHDVWERIILLLPDAKDQLLARLSFALGLKPSEIIADYGHLWPTTEDVRVDRQRIKRQLERDGGLRDLLGVV